MITFIIPRSLSQQDAVCCPTCGDPVYLFRHCCMDANCEQHRYRPDFCFNCVPQLHEMFDAETVEYQRKFYRNMPETWLDCKLRDVDSAYHLHWYRAKYPMVAKAYQFAQKAHEGQVREFGCKPCFSHSELVAWRVAYQTSQLAYPIEGSQPLETLVAAALLHDVLEDTDCTRDLLSQEFPEPVVSLVSQLTNVKVEGLTRAQQTADDHLRLKHVSNDAKLIKLVDRIDNLLELQGASKSFVTKYHSETQQLINEVFPEYALDPDCSGSHLASLVSAIYGLLSGKRYSEYEGDGPSNDPLD